MNPSMTFTLAGGPGVRLTVVQMPDGTLQITASLISSVIVGDLRGLFFQVNNESLLGGLSVTASTSSVTGFQQNANAVSNLGAGVTTLGAARASDVGIAFGTASTAGADDIRSVTFTLAHATEALTLDFLSQMQFAAVIGSVGPAGGARNATVRAVGTAPANAPPAAANDVATVAEGGSVTIDVLANDTDPNNDALTITAFTQPAKGSVALAGGALVFDAGADFESLGDGESATQTFTYTISDGRGGSATATVTVTVTGVNDAPIAQAQTAAVEEDFPGGGVAAGSLLTGATDPDANDVLTVIAVNGGTATTVDGIYGTLTWDPAGGFVYAVDDARPATNGLRELEFGTEVFTFTVSDGKGGTDTQTLTVSIRGRNDVPISNADSFTVQEGRTLTVAAPGVLANDFDPEGDPMSVSLQDIFGLSTQGGVVVLNDDGSFTYTPPAGFIGIDRFDYFNWDGSAFSGARVTIEVVAGTPLAVADSFTTGRDEALVIAAPGLLANDSDPNGDPIFAALFDAASAQGGTVTMVTDGSFTYTPPPGFTGTDTFTYVISDGVLLSAPATVTVEVTGGPPPPAPTLAFAASDVGTTPETGGALFFTLVRTGDLSGVTTVDLLLSGTAEADDLFGITGATQQADPSLWRVSFSPGQASAIVEVLIAPDTLPEPDETVTFTIVGATGAVPSATGPLASTGTILDDDIPPAIAFRSLDAGSSGEGTAGFAPQGRLAFTLDRTGDLSFATSVVFALGGTASASDIASVTGTNGGSVTAFPFVSGQYILTFDPGAASAEIELLLAPDTEVEADETVTLTLLSAAAGILPAPDERTATGVILDDDAVFVGFAEAYAGAVDEGGPGPDGRLAFTLARTGSLALDTVVRFVVQGDVTAGEIYLLGATRIGDGPDGSAGLYEAAIAAGAAEQTIEVFAVGDRTPEADETVTLALTEVVANGVIAGITSASGVFLNDDVLPAIAFRALDVGTTGEGTAGVSPQGVLIFVLERSGDLSYPTVVTLEVGGSASPDDLDVLIATNGGSLAPIPGEPGRYTLTFAANAASADIEVFVTPDALEEGPETVALTLVSAFDGRLPDLAERTATGTILDDDAPPPPPALAFRDLVAGSAPEGTPGVSPPGRLAFVVTRTGELAVATAVTFELGGTASAEDYWVSPVAAGGTVTPVPGEAGRYVLTFDAGAAEAEIELLMVPDSLQEADETVTVTLLSATGGTLPPAGARTATGTILDDDTPPPNTPPVANDVFFAIDEDTPFIANMFGFTSDAELNQASITILGTTNLTITSFDGATGAIEAQPLPDFNGIATITYRVTDAGGLSDDGVVTLTVVPVDDPPVGVPDTAVTIAGQMVVIDVLANDFDVEGEDLYAIYTFNVPQNGFAVFFPGLAGGPVHYTPNPGFVGTDSFTYTPFTIRPDGFAVPGNETLVTVTVLPPSAYAITQTGELARPEGNPDTPIGFVFEVTRTGTALPAATLTYAIGPGPGTSATSDDLTFGFGTFAIAFAAGQTSSGIVSIPVWADLVPEPDETFSLALVAATDGTVDTTPITFTILDDDTDPPPPPPATQRFYFSGATPDAGRELWVFDPESDAFATMIEAAEAWPGAESGNPRQITALGDTVFFRADANGLPTWFAWNGAALTPLGLVDLDGFDAALAAEERRLGVRSGDLVWIAGDDDWLRAFDASGTEVAAVALNEEVRFLLSDAGGSPAYAAKRFSFSHESLSVIFDHPVLGWTKVSTWGFGVDPRNDITEIAGFKPLTNPSHPAGLIDTLKFVFFAGDYLDSRSSVGFQTDELWRLNIRSTGDNYTFSAPVLLDLNGTASAVPLAPRALTVVPVNNGASGSRETLFLFGNDAAGQGRLFAYSGTPDFAFLSIAGGLIEQVTSTDLAGVPLNGLEIAPWENGVIFSAIGDDGTGDAEAVVGLWTDTNGDFAFEFVLVFSTPDGTIEHLVVDGQGNAAWVVDIGDVDRLYTYVDGTVTAAVTRFGEIDELQMADGHLVFRMGSLDNPLVPTLFHIAYGAGTSPGFEVPTDEDTGREEVTSFVTAYRSVAIPEALVFEIYDAVAGEVRLYVTDGTDVFTPGGGFEPISAGDVLGTRWVGTGRSVATGEQGLFAIDSAGLLTPLYLAGPGDSIGNEAEVLGEQVLFGLGGPAGFRIMLYDAGFGAAATLLDDHILGTAEKVGSRLVFSAFDRTRPENTNATEIDDVWDLWTYDAAEGARFIAPLPAAGFTAAPGLKWRRDMDFLGDDGRIFWKQYTVVFGVEVVTIDLTAADPTPVVIDINPGAGPSGIGIEGVFANGRLYWVASADGLIDTLRLWTTTDGTDAIPVHGPDLFGGATPSSAGLQVPQDVVTIGDEVFFVARMAGTDRWGVFQVNDDGITASRITPDTFGTSYGLAAIGPDLYFLSRSPSDIVDQMWRITPGATPALATPERVTEFPAINLAGDMRDIVLGGDGNIYFGRLEPETGRELWRLTTEDTRGAEVVFDFNQGSGASLGYAPEQVTTVPNPLEYLFV